VRATSRIARVAALLTVAVGGAVACEASAPSPAPIVPVAPPPAHESPDPPPARPVIVDVAASPLGADGGTTAEGGIGGGDGPLVQ